MASTTKKPAAKKAAPTAPAQTKKIKLNYKIALPISLVALGSVSAIALYQQLNYTSSTTINTPVIARTELNKKPTIDIKLFDENAPIENTESTIKETVKKTNETPATTTEVDPIVKNLTNLELKQTNLEEKFITLEKATQAAKIADINAKITKLESLNGNVGNLAKIFLSQQLVLLDNAFKVGGNQDLAISNIYNFAKNVAKDETVAEKLNNLLVLTKQQAIITPAALNFYAAELLNVKLSTAHIKKQEVKANATVVEKIKAFLKSFILVRKQDEVTAEQALWTANIKQLQEAVIFGNFIKANKLLTNEELIKLGSEDFANFSKLFNTYLKQQQALQAVLGAFIEGYNYDY